MRDTPAGLLRRSLKLFYANVLLMHPARRGLSMGPRSVATVHIIVIKIDDLLILGGLPVWFIRRYSWQAGHPAIRRVLRAGAVFLFLGGANENYKFRYGYESMAGTGEQERKANRPGRFGPGW